MIWVNRCTYGTHRRTLSRVESFDTTPVLTAVGAVSIKICGEQRLFNCFSEHPKYVSVSGMISEHLLTAGAPLPFARAVLLSEIFVPNLAFNLCCPDFPAKLD
jgi:hypothetical protein